MLDAYPAGSSQSVARVYDANGNETRTTATRGALVETTTRTFDASKNGSLTQLVQPDGTTTDLTYDASGQIASSTAQNSGSGWSVGTTFSWDAASRRLASQTTGSATTTYQYEDKTTRLSKTLRPDSNEERFGYDAKGLVTSATVNATSGGARVGGDTYTYDALSRISSRTRGATGSTSSASYKYDAAGQVVQERTGAGVIRGYEYGDRVAGTFGTDLLAQRLWVDSDVSVPGTANFTLARYAQIHTCATTAGTCAGTDGTVIGTTIDSVLEPDTLVDPASYADGTPQNHVMRYLAAYTGANQSKAASWSTSTTPPTGACITAASHLYAATTVSGTTGASAPTWNTAAGSTTTDGGVTWTETAACTHKVTLRSYEYDSGSPAKHQLQSMTNRTGTVTYFSYDALGRQTYRGATAGGTANQTWDINDRPTQLINDAGTAVTLEWYDDRPLLKSWTVAGGPTHTLSYDSQDRLARHSYNGTSVVYSYDSGGLAAFKIDTGSWHHLDRSQRGDILAIRDSTGVLKATARYAAYGDLDWAYSNGGTTALTDALAHDYNGRDGVVDLGGGLQWMGERVYRSDLGRFSSGDPLECEAGEVGGAYAYAGGDPVNNWDPAGTAWGNWVKGWRYCGTHSQMNQWIRRLVNPLSTAFAGFIKKKWKRMAFLPASWTTYAIRVEFAGLIYKNNGPNGACIRFGSREATWYGFSYIDGKWHQYSSHFPAVSAYPRNDGQRRGWWEFGYGQ